MQWSKRVKKRKAETRNPPPKPKLPPVRPAGSKIKPPPVAGRTPNADGFDWPAMVEMVYGNPYFVEKHRLFRAGSDEADEEALMGEADGWIDSRLA